MQKTEHIEEAIQKPQEPTGEEGSANSSDSFIRNAALFFASPFIAIAYAMALPFVGFYQFTKLSHESRVRRVRKQRKKLRKQREAKKQSSS